MTFESVSFVWFKHNRYRWISPLNGRDPPLPSLVLVFDRRNHQIHQKTSKKFRNSCPKGPDLSPREVFCSKNDPNHKKKRIFSCRRRKRHQWRRRRRQQQQRKPTQISRKRSEKCNKPRNHLSEWAKLTNEVGLCDRSSETWGRGRALQRLSQSRSGSLDLRTNQLPNDKNFFQFPVTFWVSAVLAPVCAPPPPTVSCQFCSTPPWLSHSEGSITQLTEITHHNPPDRAWFEVWSTSPCSNLLTCAERI